MCAKGAKKYMYGFLVCQGCNVHHYCTPVLIEDKRRIRGRSVSLLFETFCCQSHSSSGNYFSVGTFLEHSSVGFSVRRKPGALIFFCIYI